MLPALAELFEANEKLENLQKFVSTNAQKIYGVTPPKKSVTLKKSEMKIPESIRSDKVEVIPMMSGESISWSIESIE